MSITHDLWRSAASRIPQKSVNLSKVSKILGVRVATLWTYHHGRARWTADLWLKSLILIGAAKLENDKLVIDLTEETLKALSPIEPTPEAYRNKFSRGKLDRLTSEAC